MRDVKIGGDIDVREGDCIEASHFTARFAEEVGMSAGAMFCGVEIVSTEAPGAVGGLNFMDESGVREDIEDAVEGDAVEFFERFEDFEMRHRRVAMVDEFEDFDAIWRDAQMGSF